MFLNCKIKDNHPILILYSIYFYQWERNGKKERKKEGKTETKIKR
jgi:hypothetical protein